MLIFLYLLIVLLNALTGWLTNYIAIKLLFYPCQEKRFIFFKFQGIIPKRKEKIAERIAEIISKELFGKDGIKEILKNEELNNIIFEQTKEIFKEEINNKISQLPVKINTTIKIIVVNLVEELFEHKKEIIKEKINKIIQKISEVKSEETVKDLLKEKMLAMEIEDIVSIIEKFISKELKFLEISGGIIGLIIGIIQVILIISLF